MLPCGKVPRAVVYSGVEGNNGILGNGPQLLRLRLQCGRFWSFCWHPLFFGCKHFMITMNIERYGLGDLNSVSSCCEINVKEPSQRSLWCLCLAELQKRADHADQSVLFFLAGANFWEKHAKKLCYYVHGPPCPFSHDCQQLLTMCCRDDKKADVRNKH